MKRWILLLMWMAIGAPLGHGQSLILGTILMPLQTTTNPLITTSIPAVYYEVTGPFIAPEALPFSVNLLSPNGPQNPAQELTPILPDQPQFLFGQPNPAAGQSLVDQCTAGTILPIAAGPFGPATCEAWRPVGIRRDLIAQFKAFINDVPAAIMTAHKIWFVQ